MLEFINFLGQYIFTFILHICGNGKFPKPLSEEKEKEYLLKSKNGDIKARNILVEHNLRLVAHIIKKYYAVNVDQDDLVSIGTIGLIKAINTFDMDKNIKLSSYASRCIENEILMHFRNLKKSSQNVSLEDAVDIVTRKKEATYGAGRAKQIALIDYGAKDNIINSLLRRGVSVVVYPVRPLAF